MGAIGKETALVPFEIEDWRSQDSYLRIDSLRKDQGPKLDNFEHLELNMESGARQVGAKVDNKFQNSLSKSFNYEITFYMKETLYMVSHKS